MVCFRRLGYVFAIFMIISCGEGGSGTGGSNPHLPDSGGLCGERACNVGQSCCGGSCIETQTDINNCGGCGSSCAAMRSDACVGGHCTCHSAMQCASNQRCCPHGCKDTLTHN